MQEDLPDSREKYLKTPKKSTPLKSKSIPPQKTNQSFWQEDNQNWNNTKTKSKQEKEERSRFKIPIHQKAINLKTV